jgi:hypothetical protein
MKLTDADTILFQLLHGLFNEIMTKTACKYSVSEMALCLILIFIVFNATFSNISAISWRPVLVVEEAGVPGKNHRSWEATGKLSRYIPTHMIATL